jgi:hypothetical protein
MIRQSTTPALIKSAGFFFLVALLFPDHVFKSSPGSADTVLKEIAFVLSDSAIQWMFFLALGIYYTGFLIFRFRSNCQVVNPSKSQTGGPNPNLPRGRLALAGVRGVTTSSGFWLSCALGPCAMVYANDYSASTSALTLLAGAVLGKGAAVWALSENRSKSVKVCHPIGSWVVCILLILFAVASFWYGNSAHSHAYHGHKRWCGPWDYPNLFGLLMGTGMVLAIGIAESQRHKAAIGGQGTDDAGRLAKCGNYGVALLCVLAAGLMGLWRSTKLTRVCSAKLTQALRADARFFLPRSRGRAVTGALGVGGPEKVPVSQARHGRAVFVKRGPSITESALSAKALVFCNQDRGAF